MRVGFMLDVGTVQVRTWSQHGWRRPHLSPAISQIMLIGQVGPTSCLVLARLAEGTRPLPHIIHVPLCCG